MKKKGPMPNEAMGKMAKLMASAPMQKKRMMKKKGKK